jgi:hypothetical protein
VSGHSPRSRRPTPDNLWHSAQLFLSQVFRDSGKNEYLSGPVRESKLFADLLRSGELPRELCTIS